MIPKLMVEYQGQEERDRFLKNDDEGETTATATCEELQENSSKRFNNTNRLKTYLEKREYSQNPLPNLTRARGRILSPSVAKTNRNEISSSLLACIFVFSRASNRLRKVMGVTCIKSLMLKENDRLIRIR